MTNEDICFLIEEEGWEYVIRNLDPDEVYDAGVGEALSDLQEAFRSLVGMLPQLEEDLYLEDDLEDFDLDFGD